MNGQRNNPGTGNDIYDPPYKSPVAHSVFSVNGYAEKVGSPGWCALTNDILYSLETVSQSQIAQYRRWAARFEEKQP